MRTARATTDSGFTLIEVLVVVVVVSLAATLGFPALQHMFHRFKLEGIARKSAGLVRLSRLESIKRSRPVGLTIDRRSAEIFAILDEDGDGSFDPGERELGRYSLPSGVGFTAPLGDPVVIAGFPTREAGMVGEVVFSPDGSVNAAGGVRFGDGRQNHLELRIDPRTTARVAIRKWDGAAWRAPGEGGQPWRWN